ncbi:MAG: hypothetical protein A3G80_13800 [Betaproteobacteria bacterium RIFCSPLOWO2_12_FULL_62_13b]|nr:MAG: hypothetical protein A3G80_13800 [Betaproteobacteria bacterium RIFCSPLOWO2_12_FULL_62_13b]
MEHKHESDNVGGMKSRANIALIVFLVIAAFFLVTEHRAHLSGWFAYWPYLLLLACPLMHRFMHGGHGHGGHGSSEASNESAKEKK